MNKARAWVCWPNGQQIKEGDDLNNGQKVLVPTLSGPGYYTMYISRSSNKLTALGTRIKALLVFEKGLLMCTSIGGCDE